MSGANVSVIGAINEGMGGLKESQSAFRKHHHDVGDALLNISGIGTVTGEAVDKDEPRPTYEHRDYPKMLFHANGSEKIVRNEREHKAAEKLEFRTTPYAKAQIHVGDPQAEKKELVDRNTQLQGQVSVLTENFEKLQAQLAELLAKK